MSKAWSGASLDEGLALFAKTHDLHGRPLNGDDLKNEMSVPCFIRTKSSSSRCKCFLFFISFG